MCCPRSVHTRLALFELPPHNLLEIFAAQAAAQNLFYGKALTLQPYCEAFYQKAFLQQLCLPPLAPGWACCSLLHRHCVQCLCG